MTHKDLIVDLSAADRTKFLARSDHAGLRQALRHLVGLVVTGSWISLGGIGWQLALFLHGVGLVFLFTALHETIHDTAFASRRANRIIALSTGFLLVLPPHWFRAFHFAHHRHTNDPVHDPELAGKPTTSRLAYVWRLTGLPVWMDHFQTLVRLTWGNDLESFIPERARCKVVGEARLFLAGYVALAAGSIATGSTALLWVWVVPAILGQPFLRAYLMAEHTLCPHVPDMLENTRTTFTNRFVCALAWNMPYHAEHHSYPSVPFHKLPAFHRHIRAHLRTTSDGYLAFHRDMLETVRGQ